MRFCFAAVVVALITIAVVPAFGNPVYVHTRTKKAKKHKVPKHRTVQG
jgi:hypothetical protein